VILWSALGADDSLPDDVTTLKAMLAPRQPAWPRRRAQALLIEKLKLTISCVMSSSDSPLSAADCWEAWA
jgi:hypothetical protein